MKRTGLLQEEDQRSVSSNLSDVLSEAEFQELRKEARKIQQPSISRIAAVEMTPSVPYTNKGGGEAAELQRSRALYQKFSASNLPESRYSIRQGDVDRQEKGFGSKKQEYHTWTEAIDLPQPTQPQFQPTQQPRMSAKKKNYFEQFLRWKTVAQPNKEIVPQAREKDQGEAVEYFNVASIESQVRHQENEQRLSPSRFNRYPALPIDQAPKEDTIDKQLQEFERALFQKLKREQAKTYSEVMGLDSVRRADKAKQPDPVSDTRSRLKQKLQELERINKDLLEICEQRKQLEPTDRSYANRAQSNLSKNMSYGNESKKSQHSERLLDREFERKNFQHIIVRPPFKQTLPAQSNNIEQSTNLKKPEKPGTADTSKGLSKAEVEVQTDTKTDSFTQTGVIRRQLDMHKIAQLSDQEFLNFYLNNKGHLEKVATSEQLGLLRNRYGHLANGQSVRELLKRVLEETPKEALQQLRPEAKRKAYEMLYRGTERE